MRELLSRAASARRPVHTADGARLRDLAGTDRHQGVVAIVDAASPELTLEEVMDSAREPLLLLVLDGVTDPHNLGACLRSADAFGAHAVIVPKDRAVGVNATVAKAASGAADTVPVVTVTNLSRALRDLKEHGVWILGADTGGESLFDADVGGPVAWVLGAEGSGLRRLTRELCDRIVGIPLARRRRKPQRVGRGRDLPLRLPQGPRNDALAPRGGPCQEPISAVGIIYN